VSSEVRKSPGSAERSPTGSESTVDDGGSSSSSEITETILLYLSVEGAVGLLWLGLAAAALALVC
jgi:hypothetical protein